MNNSIPNMATDVVNQYKNHFKGKKNKKNTKSQRKTWTLP